MKKLFALVLSFCLFCGIAFAEGEASENNTGENKPASLNLASLPERKTMNSLEDVLTASDLRCAGQLCGKGRETAP